MLSITRHFHSIGAKTNSICAIVHDPGIDIRHKNLVYRISLKCNMDRINNTASSCTFLIHQLSCSGVLVAVTSSCSASRTIVAHILTRWTNWNISSPNRHPITIYAPHKNAIVKLDFITIRTRLRCYRRNLTRSWGQSETNLHGTYRS